MLVRVMRQEELPKEFSPKPPTIILTNEEYEILSRDWTMVLEELKKNWISLTIKRYHGSDWLLELKSNPLKDKLSKKFLKIVGEDVSVISGLERLVSQIQKKYGFEVNNPEWW